MLARRQISLAKSGNDITAAAAAAAARRLGMHVAIGKVSDNVGCTAPWMCRFLCWQWADRRLCLDEGTLQLLRTVHCFICTPVWRQQGHHKQAECYWATGTKQSARAHASGPDDAERAGSTMKWRYSRGGGGAATSASGTACPSACSATACRSGADLADLNGFMDSGWCQVPCSNVSTLMARRSERVLWDREFFRLRRLLPLPCPTRLRLPLPPRSEELPFLLSEGTSVSSPLDVRPVERSNLLLFKSLELLA
jgi:hypothetical protein